MTHWKAFIGKYIQDREINQGCLPKQIQCSKTGHDKLWIGVVIAHGPISLDFDVIRPTCGLVVVTGLFGFFVMLLLCFLCCCCCGFFLGGALSLLSYS